MTVLMVSVLMVVCVEEETASVAPLDEVELEKDPSSYEEADLSPVLDSLDKVIDDPPLVSDSDGSDSSGSNNTTDDDVSNVETGDCKEQVEEEEDVRVVQDEIESMENVRVENDSEFSEEGVNLETLPLGASEGETTSEVTMDTNEVVNVHTDDRSDDGQGGQELDASTDGEVSEGERQEEKVEDDVLTFEEFKQKKLQEQQESVQKGLQVTQTISEKYRVTVVF